MRKSTVNIAPLIQRNATPRMPSLIGPARRRIAARGGKHERTFIVKTDAQLKKDVEAELAWDPTVHAAAIGVAVQNGVVTLTGHLETYAEKYAAEKALRRVAGVKAIALEVDVRLSPQHQRSDTDIAAAAQSALSWNTLVPVEKIRLTVDQGWVSLQGEVDWDFQRRSVEKAIRTLAGVVGISNDISLRSRVTPATLQRDIGDALKRQVERELKHMDIRVEGSTVTLKGQVNSWHERDAATGIAWAAPGIRHVINELTIG
jgi:osmotically-inducible protein OsmY